MQAYAISGQSFDVQVWNESLDEWVTSARQIHCARVANQIVEDLEAQGVFARVVSH